jgi:hypothetical protein
MADQEIAPAINHHGETEFDRSINAFNRKATIGVVNFLYEDYPAWIVYGEEKTIAPFCRVIVGDDDDGSVLVDKTVLVTGILHLASDLTRTVSTNIQMALELPGFVMDVPGGTPHVLEIITEIEETLEKIREMAEKSKVFSDVVPKESKPEK